MPPSDQTSNEPALSPAWDEQLAQSGQSPPSWYQQAVESAAVGLAMINGETRCFLQANRRMALLTGYPVEELICLPLQRLVHPADQGAVFHQYNRLVAGEIDEFTADRRWIRRDGSVIWVYVKVSAPARAAGQPLHIVVVAEDITERQNLRNELVARDQQLRLIQDATGVGTWEIDLETGDFCASAELMRMAGRDQARFTREEVGQVLHPDDREFVRQIATNAIEHGESADYQHRIVQPGGSTRWLNAHCRAFTDPATGRRRVMGVSLDITEQKESELRIERSEQRLRRLIERLPAGAIHFENGALHLNGAAERLLGHTPEDLEAVALAFAQAEEQAPAGRPAPGEQPIRVATIVRGDGARRVVEFHGYSDDDIQVWLLHDITALRQTQEELERAKDAADAASRAKSEFLANMSHEIRTPMNGVLGMTDLLLASGLQPGQQEYAMIVKRSADSLLTLINDILDFSKIEAGKLHLDSVDFGLSETVHEALQPLALRADEKGLELLCHIEPGVPEYVQGDPTRLRQLITNLVGNAIKFTPAGEIEVSVSVEAAHPGAWDLHFQVKDTGIGIPADKQDAIFAAFSQADASTTRKYGGTGLGLSICTRLVHLMQGRIWLESRPGSGSTFHFTGRYQQPMDPSIGTATRNPACLRGLHVLAVDDNATNLHILRETLAQWGMIPETASSVQCAMRILTAPARLPISIVITDCHMPGEDGFALLAQIHDDPQIFRIPVIMLTSGYHHKEECQTHRGELTALLTKPVATHALLDALLNAVCSRRHASPLRESVHFQPPAPERSLSILLAEDNLINQRVGSALLARLGHKVELAQDGLQAVNHVHNTHYDLVFMDIEMPEMDGWAASRAIREWENGSGRRLPIVAMTAHAMAGYREQCLDAGMDGYVSKPVSLDALARAIDEVAGRRPTAARQES